MTHVSRFAPFKRQTLKWYYGGEPHKRLASMHDVLPGLKHNDLRPKSPGLNDKFAKDAGYPADGKVKLTEREYTDLVEVLRDPSELDFYQDHTYNRPWDEQMPNRDQRRQIAEMAEWMKPGYIIRPWVWYPGDLVEVVDGEFAGQRGTIQTVIQFKNKVIVSGVNIQAIDIPATEDKPAQVLDREHPISVTMVRHVDPKTNEPCELKLAKVRNKETGKVEERRFSTTSGAVLPIPMPKPSTDGDPLLDTPIDDATEETYDEAKELPVMVAHKLKALEKGFVEQLKTAYDYHEPLRRKNFESAQRYSLDVQRKAAKLLVAATKGDMEFTGNAEVDGATLATLNELRLQPKDWWFDVASADAEDSRAEA